MTTPHKDKTIAALLAALLGGLGAHRFYLYGKKDVRAWLYLFFFPLSILAGFAATLVIGLMPDERWDARFNAGSGRRSRSGWPVVLIVILTFAFSFLVVVIALARGLDLYFTGGALG